MLVTILAAVAVAEFVRRLPGNFGTRETQVKRLSCANFPRRPSTMKHPVFALLSFSLFAAAAPAQVPTVNFENQPVHALDLSPSGTLLAVAHTADARVQLFDIRGGSAQPVGHVVVGIDPVSVRFASNNELWVVNHISDSVSIVDVQSRQVKATLSTADEPFDVVFAGGRAFVSCSQANQIQVFDLADLSKAPTVVPIRAEDPRALAVSPDGKTVYAAIFESGNSTTILGGGLVDNLLPIPNAVSDSRGPYGGTNPPPNRGTAFAPPVHPARTPPKVGLIVRQNPQGAWKDDNNGDWTRFVSGDLAPVSGRRSGWTLLDRDIAVIDVASLAVRYVGGMVNIGMALSVRRNTGQISLIGTDATNEVRFEPNLNGRFLRVQLGLVDAAVGGAKALRDLNGHLNYQQSTLPQVQRDLSIGDPRGIVWRGDGSVGYISGMGSNNVVRIDGNGARLGAPIRVGEGPTGLALDENRSRLYVWNHFAASLSVIDTASNQVVATEPVFNPLPASIRDGRQFFYNTQLTSGLGQTSCASCHVDGRIDRLAWDLGDPSEAPAAFDQNCVSTLSRACEDFHAMKGPMTTQTMQDIIGHEPLHWRGDRRSIEAFNPAFRGLLGDDVQLTGAQMQSFKAFLTTLTFPPNPFRNFDNTLPNSLNLDGHYTSGRFAMAGQNLGSGSAVNGLFLYTQGLLDGGLQCASCHTLPTGMAVNGPLFLGNFPIPIGGRVMPIGAMGENHLGIVSTDGSTNVSIKVPQLRNQYEKVGNELTQLENVAGFGFLHDGSVDSLARFFSARAFSVRSDRDVADLVALTLAFSGSDFPLDNPLLGNIAPVSRDSHAATGAQLSDAGGALPARLTQMVDIARAGKLDLVAHQQADAYRYDAASTSFASTGTTLSLAALRSRASVAAPITFTLVSRGLGARFSSDRDGDGVSDRAESVQGSNPADPASRTLRAKSGLWYNPARSGHGFDLQYLGSNMFVTWYTYADDGSPTWYQAVGPIATPFVGALNRYTWNGAAGGVTGSEVGQMRLTFTDARNGSFTWQLGSRSGTEAVQTLVERADLPTPDRGGTWYNPADSGWGLSVLTEGDVRVSVLYFYDSANQPRWVLGQDDNRTTHTVDMLSFRGFCPSCTTIPVTSNPGGSISLDFNGARQASLSTDAFVAEQPSARWRKGPVAIVPLSEAAVRPEAY